MSLGRSCVDLIENCGHLPPSNVAPRFTGRNPRRINQTGKNGLQWQRLVSSPTNLKVGWENWQLLLGTQLPPPIQGPMIYNLSSFSLIPTIRFWFLPKDELPRENYANTVAQKIRPGMQYGWVGGARLQDTNLNPTDGKESHSSAASVSWPEVQEIQLHLSILLLLDEEQS